MEFLRNFFEENKYPVKLIQSRIRAFTYKLQQSNPPLCPTVPKEIAFIKLPFLGPLSFHTRNLLQKVLAPAYPQMDIRYVFTNSNTIGSLFPFKDKLPDALQSFVCYHYQCIICKNDYVGKTTCNLGKRIAEHRGISERTGKGKSGIINSAIYDHQRDTRHPIQDSAFKIIGKARSKNELLTLEAMNIRAMKPKLNVQSSSFALFTA